MLRLIKRIGETAREFTEDRECDADPYDLFDVIKTDCQELLASNPDSSATGE